MPKTASRPVSDDTDLPPNKVTKVNENLTIKEVSSDKQRFIDLLLIGDEQVDMVERYLNDCRLFIGYIGSEPAACCAVLEEPGNIVEIKNLAVEAPYRRRGIGRKMLRHVESLYRGTTMILGTGETPSTLRFYKSCGYEYSYTVRNFFTDHYDHPIVEEGVTLRDMVYLKKMV